MALWIENFKAGLDVQFDREPKVATLATVNIEGDVAAPEARSIVLRDIADDGRLALTSDGRSAKNQQLRANDRATVVVWLAKLKTQYRFIGRASILDATSTDPLRSKLWNDSSDSARAMFFWPASGEPRRAESDFPEKVGKDVDPPASFEVIAFFPDRVDVLDLSQKPHHRRLFTRKTGEWISSEINP